VRSPYGVEVVQVTPSTIALSLENSVTRQVPVAPSVEGAPAAGYVVVGKPVVAPDHIEIVGPETAVKRAVEAVTETISLAGVHDSLSEDVPVGLLDPSLRLTTQRTVHVTLKIAPGPVERTIRGLPIRLRDLGPRLSAQAVPAIVDVGIRGTREMLNRIGADDVAVYVDAAGLGEGEYMLPVHADTGERAGVTRLEPSTVQVRISSVKN
jgi:YbbR domain-containing protein